MVKILAAILLAIPGFYSAAADFEWSPGTKLSRPWLGRDLWANPMPDWRMEDRRIICEHPGGNRNVVILTRELTSAREGFTMRATVDQLSDKLEPRGGWVGFQIGLKGRYGDYRDSAVFGRGFQAGLHFGGRLFIGDLMEKQSAQIPQPWKGLRLELTAEPGKEGYSVTVKASSPDGKEIGKLVRGNVHPSWLEGLTALTVSTAVPGDLDLTQSRPAFTNIAALGTQRSGTAAVSFREITLSGKKASAFPDRAFGPILWAQHSLQNNGTLKLMAQFPPLGKGPFIASLEMDGKQSASAQIEPASCTAVFRVEGLNTRKAHSYKIRLTPANGESGAFSGTIRPLPLEKKTVTVAALSCNDGNGFPHNTLVANVAAHDPDFLAFLGDQIYEGNGGYGALYEAGERSILDYLRKYYLHGWAWRELLREIPTATIPDDHDVFHGNLWGCGGKKTDISHGVWAEAQDSGGYKMPPEFVNAVHHTQAGNLPDPYDPTPCDQGISVYYTSWEFGPIDFAIVADRQWKSAPAPMLPAADIYNGFVRNEEWDPRTQAKHPRAQLLGERQEQFLRYWASHRRPEAKFRILLSQTPWNCLGTLPEGQNRSDKAVPRLPIPAPGEYPSNDVPTIDFDSNGWPKEKRDLALRLMTEAGVMLHIAGDQHLGSTGRYGIEQWDDGPYWLATPAIANLWPRRWFPREPGRNRAEGAPAYTGQFEDQFGNKLTLLAAANPRLTGRNVPIQIGDRAPGYSIVRLNTGTGTATLENWPYWNSPKRKAPDNKPYEGWPITIQGGNSRSK